MELLGDIEKLVKELNSTEEKLIDKINFYYELKENVKALVLTSKLNMLRKILRKLEKIIEKYEEND